MTKEEHIQYWLHSAAHDLDTAESLFQNKKYDWCLFVGHLVLEKTLKAKFVQDNENQIPPKLHNLLRLAEQTELILSDEQKIFLDEVNDFNIETRYPNYKQLLYERCTEEYTFNYFFKIKEFYKWLLSLLK